MNRAPLEPGDAPDAIEEAAMRWLIERDEGFTAGRAAEFERWRAAHPAHAAAVARLEDAWAILEDELPALPRSAAEPQRPRREIARCFRPAVWLPLAAAALVVLAFAWQRTEPRMPEARYATAADSVRRVTLPDGSVVALNGASEVRVQYSPAERRVALAAGEAHFEVARDPDRPFLVTAEGVTVRAVGTAFNVRVAAAAVEVVVSEGKVRLLAATPPPAIPASPVPPVEAPPVLEAGDRALISRAATPQSPTITRLEPQQLRAALAWQQETLVFSDTPLREVIALFNRHNDLQLRLGDPELGGRLIGGTFAAGNVMAFVTLLERSGDLQVERRGDHIVLRKAR